MDEIERRKLVVAARRTDFDRWQDVENFDQGWSFRSSFVAALCAGAKVVCDIGCGRQTLRHLLPNGTKYLPADLRQWTSDTELCDLNAGVFPTESLAAADTCTLLGVVEYLFDPEEVLKQIAPYVGCVVFSYNARDLVEQDRAGLGWVNALSTGDLMVLCRRSGLVVDRLERIDGGQVVLRAMNPALVSQIPPANDPTAIPQLLRQL